MADFERRGEARAVVGAYRPEGSWVVKTPFTMKVDVQILGYDPAICPPSEWCFSIRDAVTYREFAACTSYEAAEAAIRIFRIR